MTDPIDGRVELDPEHAQEFVDLFGAKDCDEPKPSNPRFVFEHENTPLTCPQSSLTESLGSVVDRMRQLSTDFGQRPYRVFSVVYQWSGGEEGKGDLSIVAENEFLPTPLVDIGSTGKEATPAGTKETGGARMSELSPRYTEDQIEALLPTALQDGQFSFVEVRMDARDGSSVVRRRYTIKDTPRRRVEEFDWFVKLTVQQSPRTRAGELKAPMLYPARLRPQ